MGKCFSTHHADADDENAYNDDEKVAARSSAGAPYKTSPAWTSQKLAQKRVEFWGDAIFFSSSLYVVQPLYAHSRRV